jgi:acyl-CoA dehydrogenase
MTALNVARPAWMTEDLVLLEEQARRFTLAAFSPLVTRWREKGVDERDMGTKADATVAQGRKSASDHA